MIRYDKDNFKAKPGAIYTLDIETTSLFEMDDGSYQVFDYSKKPSYYAGREKIAVPYIYMFGVNDTVYYGRDFRELREIFQAISGTDEIVYIFNLSFEFQFMIDLLEDLHIERMIARSVRKPIAFTVSEWRIEFRCAYMLTGLTLERAAEQYTDVKKRAGDLDYNVARSPLTDLTETELGYCEYDIICLYKIILFYKKRYKRLRWIPYTQTGEIRKEYKKRVKYSHRLWIAKHTPTDAMYIRLQKAFVGGYVHGNGLYIKQILPGILGYDIASSYPFQIFSNKYPMYKFRPCTPEAANQLDRDKWAILYHVRFHGIRGRKFNHFILNSKIISATGRYCDNGRLVEATSAEMICTEVDFDIITKSAYKIDRIEYIGVWISPKDYLPAELRRFVAELYRDKTTLKGIPEKVDIYHKQKVFCNGLYGCMVTNILKAGATFLNGEWKAPELTPEYVHEKLQYIREHTSNLFLYQWGVWVTAYARHRLWNVIEQIDADQVYSDTDSVKFKPEPYILEVIKHENDKVMDMLQRSCEDLKESIDIVCPVDSKGNKRPLGLWELDTPESGYDKFITLGAKRYATQIGNDIKVTVSGVNNKTGYKALNNDIRNFSDGLIFDYSTAGKLTSIYNDDQPEVTFLDKDGIPFINKQRHGVVLMPQEYNMSISAEFDAYIEETQNGFKGGEWLC